MADNSLVKWGLIGVGGYLLLKHFGYDPLSYFTGGSSAVSTAAPGVPVSTTGAGTSTTPQANNPLQNAVSAQTTAQAVLAAAAAANVDVNAYHSTDTWNWYYQQVRGIAAPAPETLFPGVDRNMKHSFDEWWAAMVSAGMSGTPGMGVIANYVNPYAMSFRSLGASIEPTGFETFRVQF